jgi:hypothetical protein
MKIDRKTKLILCSLAVISILLGCKDEKEHAPWDIEGTIVTDNGKTPIAGQQVIFKKEISNTSYWEDLPELNIATDANGYFKVTVPGNIRYVTGFIFPTRSVYLHQVVDIYFHADTTTRQVKILLPKKATLVIYAWRVDPTKTKPLAMQPSYDADPEYNNSLSGGSQGKLVEANSSAEFYLDVPLDRPIHFRAWPAENPNTEDPNERFDTTFIMKESYLEKLIKLKI